jgi:hypothetical protein
MRPEPETCAKLCELTETFENNSPNGIREEGIIQRLHE